MIQRDLNELSIKSHVSLRETEKSHPEKGRQGQDRSRDQGCSHEQRSAGSRKAKRMNSSPRSSRQVECSSNDLPLMCARVYVGVCVCVCVSIYLFLLSREDSILEAPS